MTLPLVQNPNATTPTVQARSEGARDMKPDQSRELQIGQRVSWRESQTDRGTVVKRDWSGVTIKWDNGKTSDYHHNNTGELTVVRP